MQTAPPVTIADFGLQSADFCSKSKFKIKPIDFALQGSLLAPLPSKDYVARSHPGQVRLRRTRAKIQKEFDYIELSLDSGSRPP